MNKFAVLSAVAPLAMLAACAEDVEETDAIDTEAVDTSTTTTGDTEAADMEAEAKPAAQLDTTGKSSGTYRYTDPDGKASDLTLDTKEGTYSYTSENGEEKTGSYSKSDDGYRFVINDYYGQIAYFTFSDDELIRLPTDAELTDTTNVSGERYSRNDSGSDEQFTREPEIGSPVAPADLGN